MTQAKNTPGPWRVTGGMTTKYVEASIGNGWVQEVCAVGPTEADNGYGEQQEANARLIASAPDLLEALQDALRLMEEQLIQIEWEFGECREIEAIEKDGDLPSAVIKARAAIAKATGVE